MDSSLNHPSTTPSTLDIYSGQLLGSSPAYSLASPHSSGALPPVPPPPPLAHCQTSSNSAKYSAVSLFNNNVYGHNSQGSRKQYDYSNYSYPTTTPAPSHHHYDLFSTSTASAVNPIVTSASDSASMLLSASAQPLVSTPSSHTLVPTSSSTATESSAAAAMSHWTAMQDPSTLAAASHPSMSSYYPHHPACLSHPAGARDFRDMTGAVQVSAIGWQ